MKTYLLFLVACIFVAMSCTKEIPVDYIIFSGKITNSNAEYVNVYSSNFLKNISIDSTGSFVDTLMIDENGYYNYQIGAENSKIHLTKGTNLNLLIDVKQFDESISYTGSGAENNTYLAEKYLFNEQFNGTKEARQKLYGANIDEFKKQIKFQKNALIDLLLSMKLADTTFVNDQVKAAHYEYLYDIDYYIHYNPNKPQDITPDQIKSLREELTSLDINNEEDYKKHNSFRLLVSSLFSNKKRVQSVVDKTPYHTLFFDGLSEIKSETIKNDLLQEMVYYVSPGNPDAEDIYNSMMKHSTDSIFKKRITASYNKTKLLAKGKLSPTFEYENYKGGKTTLADLKGKYVYIDVWATWCVPCIQEIPYLKQLEKEYHDKSIEFVSISVDTKKDYEKWKTMVAQKELTGLQLFADNDWNSKFVQDYDIKGIPRFILIDPEGNIVNASAPRPSNPILKEIFKGLNI